jgi:phospholipid/cholesterol/gamma-HCH transport system permease protein
LRVTAIDALWSGPPTDVPFAKRGGAAPRAAEILRDGDGLVVQGDWIRPCVRTVLMQDGFVEAPNWSAEASGPSIRVDASGLRELDTLGCLALADLEKALAASGKSVELVNLPKDKRDLYEAVRARADVRRPENPRFGLDALIAAFGRGVVATWDDLLGVVGMFGVVLSSIALTLANPTRWRFNAFVTQLDKSAFRAVPIIVLIQFVIGGIVAQQSAYQLRFFGAEIFTVNLVAILVLREIGVLISAIMVAGRTGSAYTAEIGAMRMREEVDAMRVIGLDPVDVLVVPRILGLVVALPLLTIIANASALLGGMLTLWAYSGISPVVFIDRMHDGILLETVMVGLIKAPFMAIAIGCIACMEGFRVSGSTESLGQRVTAAVVKSIFAVIVMDGVFAIFFAAMDY